MFKTFRLGRLLGFPIEVNLTFLLMLGAVLLWMGGLAGVFIVLLAFASVVLHELGHALVARRLGVHVSGIELHFFGGAAKLTQQPRTARDEILIALAGPAVSFALAGAGMLLYGATGLALFYLIGWINVILGTFNLIPALPMDGGRVLRALLTYRFPFARATEISVTVSRGFAIALGVYALATTQIYLALLAVVLWMMGSAEQRAARHGGYRDGRWGQRLEVSEVEVMPPRGRRPQPVERFVSFFDRPGPSSREGRFVIRRVDGRVIIEQIDL